MTEHKCTCAFPCGGTDCGPDTQEAYIAKLENELAKARAGWLRCIDSTAKARLQRNEARANEARWKYYAGRVSQMMGVPLAEMEREVDAAITREYLNG